MTTWSVLSVILAGLLLFTILAPKIWHAIVFKENQFWLSHNFISQSTFEKMVILETGIWLKVLLFISLIGFVFVAYATV